jgi:hypothetical protein
VYNGFIAGHLLTSMRPALPILWLQPGVEQRRRYASLYEARRRPENVVLVLSYRGVAPDDPLHVLVEETHRKILERPRFAIYSGSRTPRRRQLPRARSDPSPSAR